MSAIVKWCVWVGISVLLLANAVLASEQITFNPTRLPFKPTLIISKDDEVCREVVKAATQRFVSTTPQSKDWWRINENVAGTSSFQQLHWENLGVSKQDIRGKLINVGAVYRLDIDINGNGRPETLLQFKTWWKYDEVKKVSFFNDSIDIDALIQQQPENLFWLKKIGVEIYPGKGRPTSNNRPNIPLTVFKKGHEYYSFLEPKHFGDTRPLLEELYRLDENGNWSMVCKIRTLPDKGGLVTMIQNSDISEFENYLSKIRGGSGRGRCGDVWWQIGVQSARARVDTRVAPWNMRPSEHATTDAFLESWSYKSLWNHRSFRGFTSVRHNAKKVFERYYIKSFGVPPEEAREAASLAIHLITNSNFSPPYYWRPSYIKKKQYQNSLKYQYHPSEFVRALLNGQRPTNEEMSPYVSELNKPAYFNTAREAYLFLALEHPGNVRMLIDQGAQVDFQNIFGKTPLMYAAHFDLLKTARVLLDSGANPNLKTKKLNNCSFRISRGDRTALMYAAENASPELIKLLLDHGADPAALDTDIQDMIDYLDRNIKLSEKDKLRVRGWFTNKQ